LRRQLPAVSWGTLTRAGLAIGLTLAVRIGGVFLFALLMLAVAITVLPGLRDQESQARWLNVLRPGSLLKIFAFVPALAWALMCVFWPFALVSPVRHPLEAMQTFSKYSWTGTLLFNGRVVDSHAVPLDYIPVWLAVSMPDFLLIVALSAILFGLLIDGLYFRIIPYFASDYPADLSFGSVLFTIFIAWGVFFVIALLMNSLTENLRRTGEKLRLAQKELDIKERLAAAGQVAANLAHEIRNPLAAVAGSVQVLKSELRLTNDQKNLMNIILRESERASQSIEQFLDLASPGKQVFSSINLSEVLRETLTVLKAGGELDSQYDVAGNYQSSEVRYFGNANQFKQIFWNLTKNAIKAMPRGGTLTVDFTSNGNRELAIRFADTGRGMGQESRQRLFEPFYSGFENGRGLGMAVVRRIVDDYEGKIQVSSEVDRGTTILITLPLRNRNHRS